MDNVDDGDDLLDETRDPLAVSDTAVGILNGVAAVLLVAWTYVLIRNQLEDDFGFLDRNGDGRVTVLERLDTATQSMALLAYAAVVAGLGQILTVTLVRVRNSA